MYVNKYLLIILGVVVVIFLSLFAPVYIMIIWSILFWVCYFSKKDYKKEDIQ